MNIKRIATKIPFINSMGKLVIDYFRDRSDRRIIRELQNIPLSAARKIHEILIDFSNHNFALDINCINQIEAERKRLLNNSLPLVDGSFISEGLYDGDKSIQEACMASRDSISSLFLYRLVRSLKPVNVLELGTNVGISSAYLAAAQKENGELGKVVTLDASPYRQKIAREVHQQLGLKNIEYVQGLFYETLDSTLKEIGRVDLAFIDGHHLYQPTLDYFEKVYPYTNAETVLIFDDIRYSEGMKRAWSELKSDHRFHLVIDLKNLGICFCSESNAMNRFVFPTIHNTLQNQ